MMIGSLEDDSVLDADLIDEELGFRDSNEPSSCRGKTLKILECKPVQIGLCILMILDAAVVIAEILLDLHSLRSQYHDATNDLNLAYDFLTRTFSQELRECHGGSMQEIVRVLGTHNFTADDPRTRTEFPQKLFINATPPSRMIELSKRRHKRDKKPINGLKKIHLRTTAPSSSSSSPPPSLPPLARSSSPLKCRIEPSRRCLSFLSKKKIDILVKSLKRVAKETSGVMKKGMQLKEGMLFERGFEELIRLLERTNSQSGDEEGWSTSSLSLARSSSSPPPSSSSSSSVVKPWMHASLTTSYVQPLRSSSTLPSSSPSSSTEKNTTPTVAPLDSPTQLPATHPKVFHQTSPLNFPTRRSNEDSPKFSATILSISLFGSSSSPSSSSSSQNFSLGNSTESSLTKSHTLAPVLKVSGVRKCATFLSSSSSSSSSSTSSSSSSSSSSSPPPSSPFFVQDGSTRCCRPGGNVDQFKGYEDELPTNRKHGKSKRTLKVHHHSNHHNKNNDNRNNNGKIGNDELFLNMQTADKELMDGNFVKSGTLDGPPSLLSSPSLLSPPSSPSSTSSSSSEKTQLLISLEGESNLEDKKSSSSSSSSLSSLSSSSSSTEAAFSSSPHSSMTYPVTSQWNEWSSQSKQQSSSSSFSSSSSSSSSSFFSIPHHDSPKQQSSSSSSSSSPSSQSSLSSSSSSSPETYLMSHMCPSVFDKSRHSKETYVDKLLKIAHIIHFCSIAILGVFVIQVSLRIGSMGLEFLKKKIEILDAVIVLTSFGIDLVFLDGVTGGQGEEAVAILIILLLWRIIRVINGIMVTTKKRQDFRIRLQKRARRRAEKRVEYLEDDKSWKDREIANLKRLCLEKGALEDEIAACKPRRRTIFQKMDTSMGLSSIASLSLGLSMSMTCTQQHQFKPQHRQFYSKRASVCSASFAIRPTTLPRMPSSASFHVAADVTSSTTTHSTPREATTQVEVHPSSQGTQSDKNYRHKTDEADKKTDQEEEPLTKTFQRPLSEVNNNNNNSSSSNSSSNNNNSSSNNNGTSNNSKKNPEQSCKRFTQVFKRQDACVEDDKFPQQRRRESLQRSFFLSIDEEDESIRRESDGGGTEGGNDDEDDEEGGGDDCDGCDVRCKQPLIVENGSSPNVTNKINSPSCPLLQLTDDTN